MRFRKLLSTIKPFLKSLVVIGLILGLVFSQGDNALAARSGGRMGGGSFRVPTRTYAPSRPGGGYYGGGGFGFPFLLPFFGFGGGFGGLFSILIVIAIANFLLRSFQSIAGGSEETNTSTVSVGRVQVGLLAEARSLQEDLNRMALSADTGSTEGRAQVLQEATLALLRHPEYWAYAAAESEKIGLNSAEAKFNQWTLAERSKFTEETLSNVNNQLSGAATQALEAADAENSSSIEVPGEYIVVTIVVGAFGNIQLPRIQSTDELRQVISRLGSIGSDQLLAVEVLWTPQASGDTLSSDDLLANYPHLTLV